MSYLADKVLCTNCGDLYDPDQLDENGVCRDCRMEESFLLDTLSDYVKDES